ncbi:ATP-binding protein [Owenweeksia hongkongensis]|uniref:PAS domain-containing sensor histidine kinase n=1 Tax=Owenweeksia hongkongensis TaxID=253245 RepID=UPI003A911023
MVATDRVYQLIAEHTTDLVCIHDLENTIRFATPSSKSILGFSSDDIIGRRLTDFLAPEFVSEMDFSTLTRFFDHPGSRIRYQVRHGNSNRLRWLESTFSRIEEGNKKYSLLSSTRDITESVHLTDDLMNALSTEQQLSRFKSNLYSVASHEFKTPLAVIQANIEMLKIKKSPKVIDMGLESMEEEIDRLNSMIADMLQLKKLTMGKTTLKLEDLSLMAIMEDVVKNDCTKAFPKINTTLSIAKGEECTVRGDYSLVRYIFSNLMVNACKFSKDNTRVKVSIAFEDNFAKIRIEDQGIGIPKEDQASIFTSFYRATNVSNIQGTGVGLSIVKEFVDLHKGKISFESSPGKGSTFFIELPYTLDI